MRVRAAAALLPAALAIAASPAPAFQSDASTEWTVACRPGDDGFAANCTATLAAGAFTLKLQTADSQVFVSILHRACETGYRNFDRQDLILLDPAERRALVERAFHEIGEEVRQTCPTLAPPPTPAETMPDIAILSPDMDQRQEIDLRQEFEEARMNCRLPRMLMQASDRDPRVLLVRFPQRYHALNSAERNGSWACLTHWADERGLTLRVVSHQELPGE